MHRPTNPASGRGEAETPTQGVPARVALRRGRRPRAAWWWAPVLLAQTLAESAVLWLVASLVVIGGAAHHGIPPLALGLLVVGAAFTPWILDELSVWPPGFEIGMATAMAATTLVAVKAAAFPQTAWMNPDWLGQSLRSLIIRPSSAQVWVWSVVVVAAFAWWRGRHRAPPSLDAAYATLRFGTPLVLVAVVANLLIWGTRVDRAVTGAVLAYYAATLAAIALAHLWLESGRDHLALGGRWLVAALLPIALIVGAALAAAGLLSQDLLTTILWALAPLIWALSVIARVFFLIVAVIAFLIVAPVIWLLEGHHLLFVRTPSSPVLAGRLSEARHVAGRAGDIPDAIRYLIALAIVSALFSAAARFAWRRRRRARHAPDEERESVLDLADLFGGVRGWRRRRGGRPRRPADPLAALRHDPRWAATVAVRETYQRFLRWSAERDLARTPGTTPREHAAAVESRLPAATAEAVAQLVERYGVARYGAEPATRQDAETARAALARIERATEPR